MKRLLACLFIVLGLGLVFSSLSIANIYYFNGCNGNYLSEIKVNLNDKSILYIDNKKNTQKNKIKNVEGIYVNSIDISIPAGIAKLRLNLKYGTYKFSFGNGAWGSFPTNSCQELKFQNKLIAQNGKQVLDNTKTKTAKKETIKTNKWTIKNISKLEKAVHNQIENEKELFSLYLEYKFNIDDLIRADNVYKVLEPSGRALLYQKIKLSKRIQ